MLKDKLDLDSNYEAKGRWHLSGYPEDAQMGTFTFNPNEGGRLTLINDFNNSHLTDNKLFDINGNTQEGKYVTLLDCFWIHKGYHGGSDLQPVTYRVNKALIGDHIAENYQDNSFYSVELSHHLIEEWLGDIPFINTYDHIDNSHTAIFKHPELVSFNISAIDSMFTIGRDSLIGHGGRKNMHWTSNGVITITPKSPRPLAWFSSQVHCFRQLLSFLIGEPARTRYATLRGEDIEYSPNLKVRSSTQLLYQEIGHGRTSHNKAFHEMFAPLPSIKHKIESIFNKWFDCYSELRMPLTIFLSAQAGDYTYVDTSLVALAQALEGFCRCTSDSHYLDDDKYKDIYDSIVSTFPPSMPHDLRDRLKSMLKHGNEYALKKRLKEEINRYSTKLTDYISLNPNNFIDNIVDFRNAKVHVTYDKSTSPIDEKQVPYSGLRMEIFFAICMMRILGFTEDEMDCCIKQSNRFRPITQKLE